MIRNLHTILAVLEKKERRYFFRMMRTDILLSILDILFLVLLVFLVSYFDQREKTVIYYPFRSVLNSQPVLVFFIYFICFVFKNWLAFRWGSKQNEFIYQVASRLSGEGLSAYLSSNYDNYVQVDSSRHTRKIMHQPVEYALYLLKGSLQVFTQSALVLFSLIAILIYNSQVFITLFAILLLPLFGITVWIKKKLASLRNITRKAAENSIQYLNEALSGFVESRIFFKKDFFTRRYLSAQSELNHLLSKQQSIQLLPARLMEIFAIGGVFLLLLLHQFLWKDQGSLILLGAFLAATYKIIPGISKLLNAWGMIKAHETTCQELPVSVINKYVERVPNLEAIRSIQFQHISFSFRGHTLIRDFNLQINAGELIAITGESGSGKTTMINLLLGFLPAQEGRILVNGFPIDPNVSESFLERISYVKQQAFFIHDSAFQNVILGEEDYDETHFNTVSERAGFKTFINGNLHKLITENGKNISGGQRQRLAFARALYKDFDLLILDEPFSELDQESELEMMKELKSLAQSGKIILLITHSKTNLEACTKIINLHE